MRTFTQFLETTWDYNKEQQQILARQQKEIEQIGVSDVNLMIQTLQRHAKELQDWRDKIAIEINNLPPRPKHPATSYNPFEKYLR